MQPSILTQELATNREQLYANGYAALAEGDAAGAQRYFALMLALGPLDERAWVGLAVSREQVADYWLASGFYSLASAVAPDSVFVKLGQARTLARLGRHAEAERILDEAMNVTEDAALLACIARMRGEL